ncbi:Thioredoxin family protein [Tritrichomonas foetus]|uniref:Thioredoxin family protein n=1 Tax=Tritrichomonas foetus TaxID=1144522 RepID=A0A1J4K5X4_9EUKA|nr:Thioredoxin family protein [Tritrichomonas foetus]|eukprot:OHT04869.1 Thioredoxin family protein [Tritrichomonas foetus]
MISIFIAFCSAYFETLTNDNYTSLMSENQEYPVLALLQSRWCSHCMELKPTWRRLQQHYENDTRFYFVDISCDSERELCLNFSDSGTPRIFWVKSGIESAERFINSYRYDEFVSFIEKRLSPPVMDIFNHSQYLEILKNNEEQSLFFLQVNSQENGQDNTIGNDQENVYLKNLKKIVKDFQDAPCRFFNMRYKEFDYEGPAVFRYECPWTNTTDRVRSILSETRMRLFVEVYSYPPVYAATSFFIKSQSRSRRPFMLYYDNSPKTFYGKLINLSNFFPPWFKTGTIDCSDNVQMCRLFGFRMNVGNELVIVLTYKNIYYRFTGEMTSERVYKWVNNVLDGRETAMGPGAGFKGFFFNMKMKMKEPGFWKSFFLKSTLGTIVVIFLFFFIRKCIQLGTPPDYDEIEKEQAKKNEENEKVENGVELENSDDEYLQRILNDYKEEGMPPPPNRVRKGFSNDVSHEKID